MKQRKPLVRRTPMPRGKPLQRKRPEGPDNVREPHPYIRVRAYDGATQVYDSGKVPLPRGTYAGGTSGVAIPKPQAPSQHTGYMVAVRALGYCMRCGVSCRPDFCHRNAGRGKGEKSDVREGWPGCRPCHQQVDTGGWPRAVRRAVELLLGAMTRAAIIAAGTWPERLPLWNQEQA